MITLKDAIEIRASAEQIMEFFVNFRENFYIWHPAHVDCRYLTDSPPVNEGSTIYIEEYLHGKLHKLKLHTTRVEPNSLIEYETFMGTKGFFFMEPRGTITLFTAELRMGTDTPLIGNVIDRVMMAFFSRQLEGLKQHMVEEGQNLKRILEQDAR